MKNILTVTVGICALNEEKKIQEVINSVIAQKGKNFRLKKIHVISDGSTDITVKKVLAIHDDRIFLEKGKNRKGLTKRLNKMFKSLDSDILIKLDADIQLKSNNLIELLVEPFLVDSTVGFVSGGIVPVDPSTLLEKSINNGRYVWDKIRTSVANGNGVYCCAGPVFALSSKFAERVRFPDDVWADIGYLYFSAKRMGFSFKSVPEAKVWFQPPTKLFDHLNQITRYRSESDVLYKHFPAKMLDEEYNLPTWMILKYKLIALMKHPILTLYLWLINIFAWIILKNNNNKIAKWTVIKSTK